MPPIIRSHLTAWTFIAALSILPVLGQATREKTPRATTSDPVMGIYRFLQSRGFAGGEDEREDTLFLSVCGDSITYGLGLTDPARDALPAALKKVLGTEWKVAGFGRPGATAQSSTDLPYRGTGEFGKSLISQPDVLLVMLGTNDCKPWNWKGSERFKAEYKELIASYENLPFAPDIWICLPPPVFIPMGGITGYALQSEVIPAIKELADEMEIPIIDLNAPFLKQAKLFPDGVHPDRKGSVALAEAIAAVVEADEEAIWEHKEARHSAMETAASEAGERLKD